MNRDGVIEALQAVLQRSPDFPLLMRRTSAFGMSTGREGMLVSLNADTGAVGFEYVADARGARAPVTWVETRERDLLRVAAEGGGLPEVKVSHPGGQSDPGVERLLLRLFGDGVRPRPLSEREDLVYDTLFGQVPAHLLWQSEQVPVRVLAYEGGLEGRHVFVTSGLSNPELGPPAGRRPDLNLVGFGYDLILVTEQPGGPLAREFVGWVQHLLRTREHILRLNWLEYAEGAIPRTKLAGFIVVPPLRIPESFPVDGGAAVWNLLLGVTAAELAQAKSAGVMEVAKKLADAGFADWTPNDRPSVV